jgi:hypothetical protein
VTIIASVKVRDGLILGTDSMTQISAQTDQGPQLLKSYSNARKLFRIGHRSIGVMTYGLGNIGQRSIEGVVFDYQAQAAAHGASVQDVTQGLYDFMKPLYDAAFEGVESPEPVGFYVAGYSDGQPFPEEWEFLLPRDDAPFAARQTDTFGASWRGIDQPFTRLYKGFDPYVLPPRMQEKGVSDGDIMQVLDPAGLETYVIFDGMPLQDAVNFAVWILDTTIGWATFQVGAPSCGRPLQVATIRADTGFRWVAEPEISVQS